jgi:hypothetical protein
VKRSGKADDLLNSEAAMTTKHKADTTQALVEDYSAAVQALSGLEGEELAGALLRAHHAHLKLLNESGFPYPSAVEKSRKSLLVIIKRF